MYLHHHSKFLLMVKPMEELCHPEVFAKATHYLLIYSCYVRRDLQLCWLNQKRRGDSMGLEFVEVHPKYPISYL